MKVSRLCLAFAFFGLALVQCVGDDSSAHTDGGADAEAGTDATTGPDSSSSDAAGDSTTDSADAGKATSICGSALFKGGSAGAFSAPHLAAYNPSGSFTVEAWIYPTALPLSGLANIIAHEVPAPTQHSWALGLDFNGKIDFVFSGDGSTSVTAVSANTVPLNAWSYVVGQFDAGSKIIAVYITGTGASGFTSPTVTTVHPVTAPLTIGNASDGTAPFQGNIEEARYSSAMLYTNAFEPDARLSAAASTLALFHLNDTGTTAADSSTHANTASLVSDAAFAAACEPGVCNWVHVAGGTVTAPAPTPTNLFTPVNGFTIEGWFRQIFEGYALTHGVDGDQGYGFYATNPQTVLNFTFRCPAGTTYNIPSATQVQFHAWHHWAGVFDAISQIVTFYIDGVKQGAVAVTCAASFPSTAGLALGLGSSTLAAGFYDVSEVRLSSTTRYVAPFQPAASALRFTSDSDTIALYHYDETTGTIAHDSSPNALNAGLNGSVVSFGKCQ